MSTSTCEVPGCDGPRYARGWCITHYRRWQRDGDARPDVPVVGRARVGDGYASARRRLFGERGPATAHPCAECGAPSTCWSYDGADPDELTDPRRGTRYSLDPERYRARCRYCHRQAVTARAADLPGRPGALGHRFNVERAAALYRAGATCRGIGSLMGVSANATRRALRAHGVSLRPSGRGNPDTST